MAVVLLTAPIEGTPFHRAHCGSRRSPQPQHLPLLRLLKAGDQLALYCARRKRASTVTPQGEQPDCPSLRASSDHPFYRGGSASKKDGPVTRYIFLRTSFHSFATFALRGASPLAGSGTITASRRRWRNASAKAFVRPTPILSVVQPAACISSSFAPNASGLDASTIMCPTGNL